MTVQNVNNTQFSVATIVGYNNYFKYDALKELTLASIGNDNRSVANIYIDLYKLFLDLYGRNLAIGPNKLILASMVINLCAHLRAFYRYYGVSTNFFLVYSDISNGFNKKYYPEYNLSNDLRMTSDLKTQNLVDVTIGILNTIIPYIPDVYFVKGTVEPAVIIYDLICKEEALYNNKNPHIIFSRDPMVYQVPSLNVDAHIFRCNKKLNITYATNHDNVYLGYLTIDHKKTATLQDPIMVDKLSHIAPEMLGLLMSITNLPSRYVKSLVDLPKAIKCIYGAVARNSIPNSYNSNLGLLYYNIFDCKGGSYKVSMEEFELRFRSIDLYSQFLEYTNTPIAGDLSYKTNLIDVDMVKYINNTDFSDCPLDLNNL